MGELVLPQQQQIVVTDLRLILNSSIDLLEHGCGQPGRDLTLQVVDVQTGKVMWAPLNQLMLRKLKREIDTHIEPEQEIKRPTIEELQKTTREPEDAS